MLTAEDFTSNEVIESIQIGDNTVDIVGYVTIVNNNFTSPKSSKFLKFVLNNGNGKEVQVTAWNENTKILSNIKETGQIVYIGSARATSIKNSSYNKGNVNFELLIKENSTVEVYGLHNEAIYVIPEEITIEEAFEIRTNKKIKLTGALKTEFRNFKNRDFEYTVGSITDGNYKIELKINLSFANLPYKKGQVIEVVGFIEHFPPGHRVLKIDKVEDIKVIDLDKVPFSDVLKGFRNKLST